MNWWGRTLALTGVVTLGYDWSYIPICVYIFRVEPWTPTGYGICCLVIGLGLNLFQFAIGEAPPDMARTT